MIVCYKPYVSSSKNCKKTTDVSKVTCADCIRMLVKSGNVDILLREKE